MSGSLLPLLIGLAVSGLFMFFFIWFKAMLARAFGAKRGQKRWVLVSYIISQIVAFMLFFAVWFLFFNTAGVQQINQEWLMAQGGIFIIAWLFVSLLSVWIFSACVQLGYFKSLVASVLSYVPFIAVGIGLSVIVGLYGMGQAGLSLSQIMSMTQEMEGVTMAQIEDKVDMICVDGQDDEAIMQLAMEFGIMASVYESESANGANDPHFLALIDRAEACLDGDFSSSEPVGLVATPEESEPGTTEDSDVSANSEEEINQSPHFRDVSYKDLGNYVGVTLRVGRQSGEPMTGQLQSISGSTIYLQQRRYGGMVTFPIERKDITALEAYY